MKDIVWKDERVSGFVLGTIQLGMDYGIANVHGQPSEKLACEIVKAALGYGVNCFDTAQGYGNSEVVLGKAFRRCKVNSSVKIISKLLPKLTPSDSESVSQSIETSRRNLGVDQLWCLMLHKADWLDRWNEGLGRILTNAKENGALRYLGVSVYSLDDAHKALEHLDIQVIEVPCNLWDQRMLRGEIFELARKKDKLCFVRSIYLQGLLLLSPEKVAEKLSVAEEASRRWHTLAAEAHLTPQQLSIRFGLSLNTPLVIGVESTQQIKENFQFCEQSPLPSEVTEQIWSEMSPLLNDDIINPTLWGK